MTLKIKALIDVGLSVSNEKGGYIKKWDGDEYLFQTHYGSSIFGKFTDVIKKFLEESYLIDNI